MGAYQKTLQRFGHTRAFRFVFKRTLPHIDRAVSKVTGGRYTFGSTAAPTFILVHKGRKSGKTYKTPLAYIAVDDGYALCGSNWGQEHHPAWSGNLIADPDVQVIVRGETREMHAHLASPDEKAALWPKFTAIWPAYDTYVERSGRDLRVFVLVPR
jgi:deazaflavin-dependent oxidoreductase (nitroreductase family)